MRKIRESDLTLQQVAVLRGYPTQRALRTAIQAAGVRVDAGDLSRMYAGSFGYPRIRAALCDLLLHGTPLQDRAELLLVVLGNSLALRMKEVPRGKRK